MELWEILVPTTRADGRFIHTRFHRIWDKKVRDISGGLTVFPVTRGQWVSPDLALFNERMIPVRIACTKKQIKEIISLTRVYYQQEAVMAYRISDLIIIERKPK